jgi:uncharacterized surface protein with fasciclin (FAS1) repeats
VATGLDGALVGTGPFTVFAPTDDAFYNLGRMELNNLLENDLETLSDILLFHVVGESEIFADELVCLAQLEMANVRSSCGHRWLLWMAMSILQ